MDQFYKIFGPKKGDVWHTPCVDCWWCLKTKSVTQHNRCYIPIRAQDRIDGSFRTANEVEDSMTQKFGFFHSWPCALAFCIRYFPNICYKVHDHAHRHGFVGLLAPAINPRFVTTRFNPFVLKEESMTPKQLIPSAITGMFMRRVPHHEQCTNKFRESNIVIEHTSHRDEVAEEFPQCVMDSEQLLNSLQSNNQIDMPHKRKNLKSTKPKKKTKIKATKHIPLKNPVPSQTQTVPTLNDFF